MGLCRDVISAMLMKALSLKLAIQSLRLSKIHKIFDIANQSEQKCTWYSSGFGITAFITFIGSWIYCIAKYGFLLGVGLGWLPSLIVAVIAGALWPLIALVVAIVVVLIIKQSS